MTRCKAIQSDRRLSPALPSLNLLREEPRRSPGGLWKSMIKAIIAEYLGPARHQGGEDADEF